VAYLGFTDPLGAATLRSGYPAPADRFANWVPTTRPYGDSATKLSDGGIVMFRHRLDYGASFDLVGIPGVTPPPPAGVGAVGSTTGGTIAAGTYAYVVTAVIGGVETSASAEVSVTTTGTTSSVTVSWTAVPNATLYYIYRGVAGLENKRYSIAAPAVAFVDTFGAGGPFAGVSTPGPGTNRAGVADRLIAWLLQGGFAAVVTEDTLGSVFSPCGLWPGTTPSLRLSNPRRMEYTLSAQLVQLSVSPGPMVSVYG
jgi:hypothetical protein